MADRRIALAALALVTGCSALPGLPHPGAVADELLPGQVLVRFKPGTSATAEAALQARFATGNADVLPDGTQRWHLVASRGLQAALDGLAADPSVDFAQPNHVRHLEAFSAGDGDYATDKQWHLRAIHAPDAWSSFFDASNPPGKGVTVAVVDSGVDPNHPDLKANLLPMIDEVGSDPGVNGTDFRGMDGNGHGTHVTGILGAVANNAPPTIAAVPPAQPAPAGSNAVGVAPAVTILPVKTMRADGSGDDFTIAKGMNDAVNAGAKLINFSIGGAQTSPTLAAAILYALQHGVAMIMASGNDGLAVNYPAAYPGTIPVGALTNSNSVPIYVSHGPQLALSAPGGGTPGRTEGPGIWSTLPTYRCFETDNDSNTLGFGYLSGTSMATPIVTGVAAMLVQREPNLTPAQLRARLLATCDTLGADYDEHFGYGRVNALRALQWGSADGAGSP